MSAKGHSRQDYKRSCNICGRQVKFHTMKFIGQGRWTCTDDSQILTAEQLAAHQARLPPLVVRPRRHAFIQGDVPTYLGAEARTFNLIQRLGNVLTVTQNGRPGVATQSEFRAWTAVYMAALIAEAERPASWIAEEGVGALYLASAPTAVTVASGSRLAGALLFQQLGAPEGNQPAIQLNSGSTFYGATQSSVAATFLTPVGTANAGIVFMKMFDFTGIRTWMDAAIRCGHWLRNWQRVDLRTAGYTASSGAGLGPVYVGGWARYQNNASQITNAKFGLEGAYALRFLARLRERVGGGYRLGADAAAAYGVQPVASLDTMIAEAREFYVSGKALTGNAATPLFSTTHPKSYYYAFINGGGDTAGDGLFHLDGSPETSIAGQNFAMGLRGLFELEGYSSTVADLFEYLMAFTANPTYAPAASASDWDRMNTLLGSYDPSFAMAQTLIVDNGAGVSRSTNGSAVYDLAATGLLAPLYVASGRSLRDIKDATGIPRRVRANDNEVVYPSPTSVMGMGPFGISQDIVLHEAAMMADLYRYEPKGQIQLRGLP